MARVRVHILVGFVLGAGFCKNRDKQLTHIVLFISDRDVICVLKINYLPIHRYTNDTNAAWL